MNKIIVENRFKVIRKGKDWLYEGLITAYNFHTVIAIELKYNFFYFWINHIFKTSIHVFCLFLIFRCKIMF